MSHLTTIDLPDFGSDETLPSLDVSEYESRLEAVVERMGCDGLEMLVVYRVRPGRSHRRIA